MSGRRTDAPVFIWGITMENHTPYTAEKYDAYHWAFESPLSDEAEGVLASLVEGAADASAALGKLAEYFSQCEEPTVIVFFGDHRPGLPLDGAASTVYSALGMCPAQRRRLDGGGLPRGCTARTTSSGRTTGATCPPRAGQPGGTARQHHAGSGGAERRLHRAGLLVAALRRAQRGLHRLAVAVFRLRWTARRPPCRTGCWTRGWHAADRGGARSWWRAGSSTGRGRTFRRRPAAIRRQTRRLEVRQILEENRVMVVQ